MTDTPQHTPGPWEATFDPYPDGTPYFRFSGGDGFAGEVEKGFGFTAIMSKADASLIAAAPDLLAALGKADDLLNDNWQAITDPMTKNELAKARAIGEEIEAAIAAARGTK